MRKAFTVIGAVVLAAAASGCVTAKAKGPATNPALEVPPPPPRMVEPLPSEPVAAIEPVADLPPATPTTRPRPQPPRDNTPRETAKPEPKPEPPPATEPAAQPTAPAAAPAPQIRAPGDNSETARQVRDTLDRAGKTLEKIDYRVLNRQHKESYDTAKKFMLEAEDAMKRANLQLAKFLADKADTLAKELQAR